MSVLWRRVPRRIRAIVELRAQLGWHYRATVLGVLLATLSVVSMRTSPPLVVALPASLLAVGLVVVEVHALRTRAKATVFHPRESDDYADVVDSPDRPADTRPLRAGNQVALFFPTESHLLRRGGMQARLDAPFEGKPEMQVWSTSFLVRQFRRSRMFDEDVMGLATDLPRRPSSAPVLLRPCRYYDFVTTNVLAQNDIYETGHHGLVKSGRDWFIDRHGALRPLTGSWLANVVGISTLAFTRDGKLVVVQQSHKNTGSPGLFAPSGSGALEPRDWSATGTDAVQELGSVVMTGANRELREECAVEEEEIGRSAVTGYARWISRGAMPELYGVTLLEADHDDLRYRRAEGEEQHYVESLHFVSMSPPQTWDAEHPLDSLPPQFRTGASLPLAMALTSLMDAVTDEDFALTDELLQRTSAAQRR